MNRILIVKVGETLPSLLTTRGDFEDWAVSGMGVEPARTLLVDVRDGAQLPGHDGIAGVVVLGSHAMVTEHQDWSERTAAWLVRAVARGIPVLGICYGHQLLAYALGGQVGDNPNGLEFGMVDVHLHKAARQDPLLGGFPSPIQVHVGHFQSVLRLPEQGRRLASSAIDPNHAFVVGDSAWGVQFHPEFDAAVVSAYIQSFSAALREAGQNPKALLKTCADTPYGAQILRRFVEIVDARGGE